jgi:hypothetical protein
VRFNEEADARLGHPQRGAHSQTAVAFDNECNRFAA